MENGKIICNWLIEIITPVHIGTAQEKHWQNNLDFVIKNNKVYFLDEAKIIKKYGIDKYSEALAKGKVTNLPNLTNNLNGFANRVEVITGYTGEIKQHIKNSLTNKPIIPGSSLKGAIRSVILSYLVKENPRIYISKSKDIVKIFGGISKDFMRYIEVADVEFDKTEIFNSKIYNLVNDGRGFKSVWKNGFRDGNDKRFNQNSFTTGYECISPRQKAKARIVFNIKAYNTAKKENKVHRITGLDDLLNENFEDKLLNIVKEHNDSYLDKELKFFSKYNQAQYGEDVCDDFKYYADEMKEKTGLRLAAGSGFHSITGDWQFESHDIDFIFYNRGRSRGKYQHKNSAKSRKLVFEKDDEGNYYFYPMGFVALDKN